MMRPLFVAAGATPARSLAVDAGLKGAEATYSHWLDAAPVPRELAADTSTGMLALAARDPTRWLSGFPYACNDHVDADGLLALALACRPALAIEHAPLMIGAAEAGDFSSWPGEAPFRLMLRLHQLVRAERLAGGAWEQRCYERAVDGMEEFIADSRDSDGERDAQVAQVLEARTRLRNQDGFRMQRTPGLVSVAWSRRMGHASDGFLTVHQPDDLPIWALDGVGDPADHYLLAMAEADGTAYQLHAPGFSWARVVHRPTVSWRAWTTACAELQAQETGACRWLSGRDARALGFVCQLLSSDGAGQVGASRLPYEKVRSICATTLASGS